MKRLAVAVAALTLAAGSALAADLPSRKAEPLLPPPPPPPMWNGFYVGLNAGGTWGNNSSTSAFSWTRFNSPISMTLMSGTLPVSSAAGFIGGGQIGYNRQIPNFFGGSVVVGVEADMQGVAGSQGAGSVYRSAAYERFGAPQLMTSATSVTASLDYLGTVRGRLGYLVYPSLLIYGTGGFAYGGVTTGLANQQTYTDIPGALLVGRRQGSTLRAGWTAGGGIEWMFSPNWSAKVEYMYYNLGRGSSSAANAIFYGDGEVLPFAATQFSTPVSGNIVRAGVNYHFNWDVAQLAAKF